MRSADAETLLKSLPSFTPIFFSMSLRLGQPPRMAEHTLVSAGPDYQDPLVMINARLFRALVDAPSNIGHSCFPRLLAVLPLASHRRCGRSRRSPARRAGASPPNGSPPPLSRRRLAPPFLTTLIKAKQLYQFSSLNTVQTPLPSLPKYLKIIQSDIGLLSE